MSRTRDCLRPARKGTRGLVPTLPPTSGNWEPPPVPAQRGGMRPVPMLSLALQKQGEAPRTRSEGGHRCYPCFGSAVRMGGPGSPSWHVSAPTETSPPCSPSALQEGASPISRYLSHPGWISRRWAASSPRRWGWCLLPALSPSPSRNAGIPPGGCPRRAACGRGTCRSERWR